jgi:hypothetical protein
VRKGGAEGGGRGGRVAGLVEARPADACGVELVQVALAGWEWPGEREERDNHI